MTTLSQLKTSVDAWLSRDDVAVSGDDFDEILLIAEAEIATEVRALVQEKSTTVSVTGRSKDLPADFMQMRNVFLDDNNKKIEYQTPEAIRETAQWRNGRAGSWYTLEGGSQTAGDERVQITIAGPASVASPTTLHIMYWARFAALSASGDTNWLLTNFFNIYLYATLRAACEYIQEDALEDRYAGKLEVAIGKFNKAENRKRYGSVPKQSYGSPRTTV